MIFFQAGGTTQPQLGKEHWPVGAKLSLKVKRLGIQNLRCFPQQSFVILSVHQHIQIVIPGDEALMPDRTQKRTGKQKIGNIQLFTNSVEFTQEEIQGFLMFLQGCPLSCLGGLSYRFHTVSTPLLF